MRSSGSAATRSASIAPASWRGAGPPTTRWSYAASSTRTTRSRTWTWEPSALREEPSRVEPARSLLLLGLRGGSGLRRGRDGCTLRGRGRCGTLRARGTAGSGRGAFRGGLALGGHGTLDRGGGRRRRRDLFHALVDGLHDERVGTIEELHGRRVDDEVADVQRVVDVLELREVDVDAVLDVLRQRFDAHVFHRVDEHTADLERRRATGEVQRHLRVRALREADPLEIDVEDLAGHGVARDAGDEGRHAVPADPLEREKGRAAPAAVADLERASVGLDRLGLGASAVDHTGQDPLPAE